MTSIRYIADKKLLKNKLDLSRMICVAVVDDQSIVHEGFIKRFELASKRGEDMCLVHHSYNGNELFDYLENDGWKNLDILLVDFQMPEMNGIEIVKRIKSEYPAIKTILFSNFYEENLIRGALAEGASSYLPKDTRYEEFITCIKEVYSSNYYLRDDFPPEIIKKMIAGKEIKPTYDFTAKISKREIEVAILIAKGVMYKNIAPELGISVRTVEDHKAAFYKKTKVNCQAGLTIYCIWMGWL